VGGGGWYPFNVTDTAPTGATHAEFRFDITISGGGQSITPDAFYLDSIRLEAVSNYTTLQFGVGTSYDVNLYGNSFNGFVIGANAASNAMLDVRGSGIVTGGLNVGATSGALDGSLLMLPAVQTSGSPNALKITGAAHTSLAASTEASDVLFNLDRTVQFATGALSNQRAVYIKAPTYSFVGASTLSSAATLAISGAPVAGTNATVTNRWALLLESGDVSLASGSVRVSTALGARAYHNAAQAIATGVWTSLALNSELFDNDAIHDLVTNNSRMTCKTSGVYIITGTINIAAAAGGTWRGARFYLNGATPLDTSLIPLSANQASVLNVSGIYNLAVNDYVELQMYQDTGGNVNAVYQANVSPMLSMVRVA